MNEPMKSILPGGRRGPAERVYLPADSGRLCPVPPDFAEDEPVYVMGSAATCWCATGMYDGTVVVLHSRLNELRLEQRDESGGVIYAQAGCGLCENGPVRRIP